MSELMSQCLVQTTEVNKDRESIYLFTITAVCQKGTMPINAGNRRTGSTRTMTKINNAQKRTRTRPSKKRTGTKPLKTPITTKTRPTRTRIYSSLLRTRKRTKINSTSADILRCFPQLRSRHICFLSLNRR